MIKNILFTISLSHSFCASLQCAEANCSAVSVNNITLNHVKEELEAYLRTNIYLVPVKTKKQLHEHIESLMFRYGLEDEAHQMLTLYVTKIGEHNPLQKKYAQYMAGRALDGTIHTFFKEKSHLLKQ